VEHIAARFQSLNCYDPTKVRGSILKIEKVNFDGDQNQIELFGYAISAKRYALYRYKKDGNIEIVDAKAHGLGYLYPPKDAVQGEDPENDWIFETWRWLLEGEVAKPTITPAWFSVPAVMQITVSTPAVLGTLKGFTKPFNFVHVPLLFPCSYPAGKSPSNFSLIMPFSKRRDQWLRAKAIDVHSGEQYPITLLDPNGRTAKIEVKCYGNVLGAYREHPEAKFLGHEGTPCDSNTRGLLRRSHIIEKRRRYIGKETSRRWEQGDDLSMVDFRCAEFAEGRVIASDEIRERITEIGIREVARRSGINRETVAFVAKGEPVKALTLQTVMGAILVLSTIKRQFPSNDSVNDRGLAMRKL
jgi:hypothetical protein